MRYALGDLDENAVAPKWKQRRKAGRKTTEVLSDHHQLETVMCVSHDRSAHDLSILKILADRQLHHKNKFQLPS